MLRIGKYHGTSSKMRTTTHHSADKALDKGRLQIIGWNHEGDTEPLLRLRGVPP